LLYLAFGGAAAEERRGVVSVVVDGNMRVSRRDKMMALLTAMEQLILEVREELEDEEERVPSAPGERVPDKERVPSAHSERVPTAEKPLRRGQRVRITLYRYRGRVGTIVDRRGKHYWDISLDARDGGAPLLIYKKASSFVVID
jgi:hypothetical protein